MQGDLPKPTISRLCLIYRILDEFVRGGVQTVSSSQIAERLSMNSHNVRKDIGYLGDVGSLGAGYDVEKLKTAIASTFGLDQQRNACVVGLGRLGTAILNFEYFETYGYAIVAGFESNINKIETMRTTVPLFPSHQIAQVVKRFNIDLGIIAVPEQSAQKVADQLVQGGVQGIVNLTPTILKTDQAQVFVSNMSIVGDFNYLSALITLNNKTST